MEPTMRLVVFVILVAVSIAALAHAGGGDRQVRPAVEAENFRPPCTIKRVPKYDYAGNSYIKKVRTCR
jgi:hypothetical protein